jgi:EAL domain-containing protein (putative c-di-GMP-specific phosphodiesterase class I)/GGDEF domain-containing protein
VYIEVQPQDNPGVEKLLAALEVSKSETAEALVRKGRTMASSAPMSYGQSVRLALLVGTAYERTRRLIEAVEVMRTRIRDIEGANNRYWRGRAQLFLANLYLLQFADFALCARLCENAIVDFESAREKEWVAATFSMLGAAQRAAGEYVAASDSFRRSIAVQGPTIPMANRVPLACSLAGCLVETGRFGEAEDVITPVLVSLDSGASAISPTEQAMVYAIAAVVKAAHKNKRLAETYLQKAQELSATQPSPTVTVWVDLAAARVLEINGKASKAIEQLGRISQYCGDHGMPLQQVEVLRSQVRLGKDTANFGAALGATEAIQWLNSRLEQERNKLRLTDLDSQRNLEAANEYTRRLQREVDQQTRTLAETVKRLESEAQQRVNSERRSEYLAGHDLVTGLPIRRRLFSQATEQAASRPLGQSFGVLLIGIEPPSGTMSHLGTADADALLLQLAGVLADNVGDAFLGRYSDWKFACVTKLVAQEKIEAACAELAEIIYHAITQPVIVSATSISVKSAVGMAVVGQSSPDISVAFINADAALEHAAAQYAPRTRMFDDELSKKQLHTRQLRESIPSLNASSGLFVCFQPLVDANTGQVRGFESLARWQHPLLGTVSPTEFIPMAESFGLMDQLGLEIARLAFADYSQILRPTYPDSYVTVNVSMSQLRDPHFVSNLLQACRDAKVPPLRVLLEMTESQIIEDDGTVGVNLSRLRNQGFRFAIDDFGTGYSSLWRLSQLDVQTIKVARELVIAAGVSEPGKKLLNRAVQICHDLGRVVVAEGIEGESERQLALDAGCDQLQGYMFSKPLRADELISHLTWQQATAG